MSTIRIHRHHAEGSTAVRRKAENIARRIAARHAVSWRWQGDSLELEAPTGLASGTRGRVTIGEGDVAIEIELPLLLRPMRRMVEREVSAKLDAALST
ncbi:MAG: polyhydroxyalkanoic acid system family protein [Myxococcales bacterium]|nr:polyhydroxyalkanoic acid system family protein [Myxococcales bacterium]